MRGVPVVADDVRNAYLQSPTLEKDFIIFETEFGLENVGNKAIITRALYGGKASGRDF